MTFSEFEVHIWRADLDWAQSRIPNIAESLSQDEKERASRFHFERDRNRFIAGRAILRGLLGQYLGIRPAEVRIQYGVYGKPTLREMIEGICFNMSHSQNLAVYGFTQNQPLGIDIEAYREMSDADQIAQRYFSPKEYQAYLSVLPEQKLETFYRCWTRKEAYMKATGEGFYLPLDQFEVSLKPDDPPALLWTASDPQEHKRWSLLDFKPADSFAGAVVVHGSIRKFSIWDWAGPLGRAKAEDENEDDDEDVMR